MRVGGGEGGGEAAFGVGSEGGGEGDGFRGLVVGVRWLLGVGGGSGGRCVHFDFVGSEARVGVGVVVIRLSKSRAFFHDSRKQGSRYVSSGDIVRGLSHFEWREFEVRALLIPGTHS